jgi:hypothetical protein
MIAGSIIAETATLVADPARARMVSALLDLTDSFVARECVVVDDEAAEITTAGRRFFAAFGIELPTRRSTGRHFCRLCLDWFGSVGAEGLPETLPSQWGDDYGVAALHPFQPAEIEVAIGDRGPQRTREMWASLSPRRPPETLVALCEKLAA